MTAATLSISASFSSVAMTVAVSTDIFSIRGMASSSTSSEYSTLIGISTLAALAISTVTLFTDESTTCVPSGPATRSATVFSPVERPLTSAVTDMSSAEMFAVSTLLC